MWRSPSLSAATGASGVDALATNPAGTPVMESAWLIHTSAGPRGGQSANNGELALRVSGVRPYSPRPVRATVPPSCWVRSWAP